MAQTEYEGTERGEEPLKAAAAQSEPEHKALRLGTPAAAAVGAVCGVCVAISLLAAGFWKTLFIALLGAAGAFIGGVKDKGEWLKRTVNRLFPPKNSP